MNKTDILRVAGIVANLGKFSLPQNMNIKGKMRFDARFSDILKRIVSNIDNGKMAALMAMDVHTQE